MTSVAHSRVDYDVSGLSHILRRAIVLSIVTVVVGVALAFITRLMAGAMETVVGGIVLLFGLTAVTALPGIWTRARTIEGVAAAAGIGLASAVGFLLIDVALLQPLGIYTNRWREVGGGSNWWYHPIWWMVGTFLPWMGGWMLANQLTRNGQPNIRNLVLTVLGLTLLVAVVAILIGVPGAGWNLGTFAVAVLPALALGTILTAVGKRRT